MHFLLRAQYRVHKGKVGSSAMLIEKCSLDIVEQCLCCALQCSPDTGRPLEGNRGNMCPPLTTRTSQLSTIHFENHDNRDGGLCVFFNHFRCHTVVENQKPDLCLKPSPIWMIDDPSVVMRMMIWGNLCRWLVAGKEKLTFQPQAWIGCPGTILQSSAQLSMTGQSTYRALDRSQSETTALWFS